MKKIKTYHFEARYLPTNEPIKMSIRSHSVDAAHEIMEKVISKQATIDRIWWK